MTTRKLIELSADEITYQTNRVRTVRLPNQRSGTTNVFSDETFLRLWFLCETIEQFVESYAFNHRDGYRPSEQSCLTRADNISDYSGVSFPPLTYERYENADEKWESYLCYLRNLAEDLRSARHWESPNDVTTLPSIQ